MDTCCNYAMRSNFDNSNVKKTKFYSVYIFILKKY